MTTLIELPFPPASLSGHNKGHWHAKSPIVAKHRKWACMATLASARGRSRARRHSHQLHVLPARPARRPSQLRYRIKAYADGIADALKVNDKRFLPAFHFAEPCKVGKVAIVIGGAA
jgi:hypothetical protein